VAYDGILYKDESMRSLMIVLACTAGLSAQVAESDASAKLKQFEQNLANPLKFRPGAVVRKTLHLLATAAARPCAIPLLVARPDPAFKSNMPMITPDPNVRFSGPVVILSAPSCDETEKK
jgi:hypothetical protein